ncbi:hypothetical protein [Paraburkholderia youngii]|uniref:Uncharacterized protein n=1 Tax=Paraburkholderia youngii TaxID=2782701 RepID=A0A7W8LCF6_9BURK|nr:hypothetical protein [Paraburkholderia youngii]MBB5404464.1 hypothetical protein [Paraburkholderia youngii]
MTTTSKLAASVGGRKEVLTLELAGKIVRLIERMPDAGIPVTWDNVVLHVKRQFKKELRRNVLSQKEWDGRKLLTEAYQEAKNVEKRLQKQEAPKYANSSRAVLRKRIEQLEAKVLALQEELEKSRLNQLSKLDLFRATRMDLRQLRDDEHGGKGE